MADETFRLVWSYQRASWCRVWPLSWWGYLCLRNCGPEVRVQLWLFPTATPVASSTCYRSFALNLTASLFCLPYWISCASAVLAGFGSPAPQRRSSPAVLCDIYDTGSIADLYTLILLADNSRHLISHVHGAYAYARPSFDLYQSIRSQVLA